MKKFILLFVLAVGLTILFGCQANKDQQAANDQPGVGNTAAPAGEVTYQAPKEWIEETPASRMRKAQFRLPGANGAEDAVLAVFFFPGTGGSVEANLNRWYRQFKQPDGSLTKDLAKTVKFTVNGLNVTVTYVTGTYLQPQNAMMMSGPVDEKENYAMWAAIAETAGGPWFFKAIGPKQTIDRWRPQFDQFVQTFRISKKSV